MEKNYQNIFNVVVVILIVALAAILFSQQKTINQLKKANGAAATGKVNASQIDRDKKISETTVNSIQGKITGISGNTLTVEAVMPNWEKMKEPRDASTPAPTYKKTYTVTVDDKTKFFANNLDSLKVGDSIEVSSKELVYQTDKLTAVFVISPGTTP